MYLSDIKSYICLGTICICPGAIYICLGAIYRYLLLYSYLSEIKSYICPGAIYLSGCQTTQSTCARTLIFTLLPTFTQSVAFYFNRRTGFSVPLRQERRCRGQLYCAIPGTLCFQLCKLFHETSRTF